MPNAHLIGIGGIGLSAVAKLLLSRDWIVSGSDIMRSEITDDLSQRGATISIGHDVANLPEGVELVIYSSAIPDDNVERNAAVARGTRVLSYSEYLGELSGEYSTIVVCGTNGKSTTTAMLGLILEAAGYDPSVLVGSLVPQFPLGNLRLGHGRFLLVEGCEYRANFLHLKPEVVVLTNIEADHLDYFRDLSHIRTTFQTLIEKVFLHGFAVINSDDHESRQLSVGRKATYGFDNSASYRASERRVVPGGQRADVFSGAERLGQLSLRLPGKFNLMNALAATAAARELGVPFEICTRTLASFAGLWRRFERVGTVNGAEIISDYGHHPTSVVATIDAAREFFPGRRLVHCFQPHQHSRTKELFKEFVAALPSADIVILTEIYRVTGRTEAEEKEVSSHDLVDAIQSLKSVKPVFYAADLNEAEKKLREIICPDDVVIIQGAGDVDMVARNLISSRRKEFEPLSHHTNFRIGGPARWFVDAKSVQEVAEAVHFAERQGAPWFVLGGGSNTLIGDEGFPGVVIKIAMREVNINDTLVSAEAGAISSAVARATAAAGLAGFAWAISLPGTIGGAVRGNAGCFGGAMQDIVESVTVWRNDKIIFLTRQDLAFGYRDSAIKHSRDIILAATLRLTVGDRATLLHQQKEFLDQRKFTQPLYAGSAGCIFKNPPQGSAGKIIDELGLKGTRVGAAQISREHGNFIVNLGQATAADVRSLIALVKKNVHDRSGIKLEEEVQYL